MAPANGISDAARYMANMLASMQHNYHWRLKGVLKGKVSALGGIKKLWVKGVQGAKSKVFQPIATTTASYTSVQGIVTARASAVVADAMIPMPTYMISELARLVMAQMGSTPPSRAQEPCPISLGDRS